MKRLDELQMGDIFYMPRKCDAFDMLHAINIDKLDSNEYTKEDLMGLFTVKHIVLDVYDDHIYVSIENDPLIWGHSSVNFYESETLMYYTLEEAVEWSMRQRSAQKCQLDLAWSRIQEMLDGS